MAQDTGLQKQIQRIGEIVEQLESASDPSVRAVARELLECLMALHGAGLERILEVVSQTGEAGGEIVQKCGRDELVSSLLLLYGLHPDDLRTRVTRAVEKSQGYLEKHGGAAELISVSEHGEVRVEVRADKEAACLSVSDTGTGIPPQDIPHLFERFYRVDKSRSRIQGKTGLGLAICKAIVEAHSGSIRVTSDGESGSTFEVRLPLRTA